MPQVQLPIFPAGVTHITDNIAFQCEDGKVCYLNGHLPVFLHDQNDLQTFRLFTTQLVINDSVKQGDIAGADIAIAGNHAVAGVIVYRLSKSNTLVEIERKHARTPLKFPYVPGILSFREGPPLLSAFQKIEHEPDVVIFDGQGIAHPRGFGLASHMGLWLDLPTIGCAKSRLFGRHEEPGPNAGDSSPLMNQEGAVIGAVLRTRPNVKPIYVSVGHRIDLASSVAVVLASLDRTRIPKPTREADRFVGEMKF